MKMKSGTNSISIAAIILSVPLLAFALSLDMFGQARADGAADFHQNFLPAVLGDQPILPPATSLPPTLPPTSTSTPTPTSTSTATPTSTSTATPTSTSTATPTSTNTATATATATPTVTNTPDLTTTPVQTATLMPDATAVPCPAGDSLLVFDWNKAVTEDENGFALYNTKNELSEAMLCNWTQPEDFANGTVYIRVEVRSQPTPQSNRIQYCIWQKLEGDEGFRETCASSVKIEGTEGNVVELVKPLQDFSKKGGQIDWAVPRSMNGFAVKNTDGCPVSKRNFTADEIPEACPVDEAGIMINWAGEDPTAWYDLDVRVMSVVVAQGGTFPGWDAFIGSSR